MPSSGARHGYPISASYLVGIRKRRTSIVPMAVMTIQIRVNEGPMYHAGALSGKLYEIGIEIIEAHSGKNAEPAEGSEVSRRVSTLWT